MSTQHTESEHHKIKEERDELSTEADSFIDLQKRPFLLETNLLAEKIAQKALEHHQIAANVSKSTFNSDKILKLTSAVLKVFRSYGLTDKLKGFEKIGGEIGQVRRLLRVDRIFMLLKQFVAFYKKSHKSLSDKLMIVFKIMILFEDFTDLAAFCIQLRLLRGQKILGELRKKVSLLYFLQCLGWFIYHTKEYYKSSTPEEEYKNKMAMLKYVLDGLLAHNEIAQKLFTIDPKNLSLLGLASGALNLYLVWK